jgi:hypothetical protein
VEFKNYIYEQTCCILVIVKFEMKRGHVKYRSPSIVIASREVVSEHSSDTKTLGSKEIWHLEIFYNKFIWILLPSFLNNGKAWKG